MINQKLVIQDLNNRRLRSHVAQGGIRFGVMYGTVIDRSYEELKKINDGLHKNPIKKDEAKKLAQQAIKILQGMMKDKLYEEAVLRWENSPYTTGGSPPCELECWEIRHRLGVIAEDEKYRTAKLGGVFSKLYETFKNLYNKYEHEWNAKKREINNMDELKYIKLLKKYKID